MADMTVASSCGKHSPFFSASSNVIAVSLLSEVILNSSNCFELVFAFLRCFFCAYVNPSVQPSFNHVDDFPGRVIRGPSLMLSQASPWAILSNGPPELPSMSLLRSPPASLFAAHEFP